LVGQLGRRLVYCKASTYTGKYKTEKKRAYIHTSSGIGTHDLKEFERSKTIGA